MADRYPVDYLFQEQIKYEDRVRDWMKTNLSCDIPTYRILCREYYGQDPYLDVVFLGPEPYLYDNILARFTHDPMKRPRDDGQYPLVWGDEIVINGGNDRPARRLPVSPALLKAFYRVLYDPD
jgi:hypothetical protein